LGRNNKSIYEAVATIRDIIAYAEDTQKPICLLSIDFKDALDNISHTYLFNILREHGISDTFCERLKTIYPDATSNLTLNGLTSIPIKTASGVRQGCPLSMILFVLCINPLLIKLDSKIHAIKVRNNTTKTTAVAYADDIAIFIAHPGEIDVIKEILHEYMNATGARVNGDKSRAMALGSLIKTTPIMNIKYYEDIKILGFHMTANVNDSAKKNHGQC